MFESLHGDLLILYRETSPYGSWLAGPAVLGLPEDLVRCSLDVGGPLEVGERAPEGGGGGRRCPPIRRARRPCRRAARARRRRDRRRAGSRPRRRSSGRCGTPPRRPGAAPPSSPDGRRRPSWRARRPAAAPWPCRRSPRSLRAWSSFLRSASVSGLAAADAAAEAARTAAARGGAGALAPVRRRLARRTWAPAPSSAPRAAAVGAAGAAAAVAGAGAVAAAGPFFAGRRSGRPAPGQGGGGDAGGEPGLEGGAQLGGDLRLAVPLEAVLDLGQPAEGLAEPFELAGAVLRQGEARQAVGERPGLLEHAEAGEAQRARRGARSPCGRRPAGRRAAGSGRRDRRRLRGRRRQSRRRGRTEEQEEWASASHIGFRQRAVLDDRPRVVGGEAARRRLPPAAGDQLAGPPQAGRAAAGVVRVAGEEVDEPGVEQGAGVGLRAAPEVAGDAHRGHLGEGAERDQAGDQLAVGREPGDELRVGEDRPPAGDRQLVDEVDGLPRAVPLESNSISR